MERKKLWIWMAGVITAMLLVSATTSEARIKRSDLKDPRRDYTQRGIQIYAGFGSQRYEIDDHEYEFLEEVDDDGMIFLGGAIGLDRGLALYLEGAGSEHSTLNGDMTFGYAHVGIKYAPQTGRRHLWQPYGKVSIGAVFLWEDDHRHFNRHHGDDDNGYFGPSIGFAAGVDRFIGRRTAIFAEVGLLAGELETRVIDGKEFDLANDIGINSGRFLIGVRVRL